MYSLVPLRTRSETEAEAECRRKEAKREPEWAELLGSWEKHHWKTKTVRLLFFFFFFFFFLSLSLYTGYGHIAVMCPSRQGAANSDEPPCYKCSGKGHRASMCPNLYLNRDICYRCGMPGHIARCPPHSTHTTRRLAHSSSMAAVQVLSASTTQ